MARARERARRMRLRGARRSRAPSGLVELCARALVAGRDAAAPVALHVLAKATAADPRGARLVADRRTACAERCGPLLAAMLLGRRGEHLRGPAADVLLNVSAERRACRRVARLRPALQQRVEELGCAPAAA